LTTITVRFTRRRGLCKATYSRVCRRLDVAAFDAAVSLGAQVMAVLRNLVIYLCSFVDKPSLAAATRNFL
jgi:hypothetical protein